MRLAETAPFIRYSFKITMKTQESLSVSRDCRLFYIIKGKGTVCVNGVARKVSEGTVMLWQQGTRYKFICPDIIEIISINFDYTCDNSDRVMPYQMIYLKNENDCVDGVPEPIVFEDSRQLNEPLILPDCSYLLDKINKVLYERMSQQMYYAERSSALFKECIIDLLRKATEISGESARDILETVVRYIHDNYKKNITNATIAALVNYHPYYLNRIFLAAKGMTMHRYVINYRITISEHLLISTDNSITDIAETVGFANPLSFTSSFKKKNGISPSEFRRKYYKSL